ncbi:MAG: ABC transporter substrate-binding protein [Acidobacteriota bacterium]|nr:ABC transporter substrate-binding protein [Acidobacteriota bacterium]
MRDETADRNFLGGQNISIGIGATLSGKYAAIGREMGQAATLAIEEGNFAGGIAGATLSAYALDDEGSTEAGEHVASQFCAREGLLGVVRLPLSTTSATSQ